MGKQTEKMYKYQVRLLKIDNLSGRIHGDEMLGYNEFMEMFNPTIEWCENNLTGNFSWIFSDPGYFETDITSLIFNFQQKTDAMAFKLRWI